MHGEWTLYDTTGKLLSTIMFDKGVEVGGKTHDAETGLPATTVKVKRNGNKEERNQYSITNKLISTRYYADEDLRKLVAYDTISGKITYEMELKNDQMHGDFRFYNKNGEVILVERYEHDEQNGITTEYDRDNDISATYTYKKGQKHGAFTMTAANKKWMEGNYANDSLDGSWLVYFPSGKLKRRLVFKTGQAISDSCFDEGGKQVKLSPFIRKAQFRGNVMTYIGDNLRYPAAAKEKGIEGRVLVRFTINESGHVSDVIAQKSVDPELDAEAVRLVSQMPPWQPEQVDAKKIKCRKTLPIVFWIPDTDKK
jgi:periplasmic protein TonB